MCLELIKCASYRVAGGRGGDKAVEETRPVCRLPDLFTNSKMNLYLQMNLQFHLQIHTIQMHITFFHIRVCMHA